MTSITHDSLMFFGVLPSPAEREATIASAGRALRRAEVLAPIRAPSLLHMTAAGACYVSELTDQLLQQLTAAGDRVVARAFQIHWQRAVRRSSEAHARALKLVARRGAREARLLQESVRAAIRDAGIEPISGTLPEPHVTLLYGQGDLSQIIEPVCWTARELVLIQSITGQTRYVVRGRWQLQPPLDGFQQEFDFS